MAGLLLGSLSVSAETFLNEPAKADALSKAASLSEISEAFMPGSTWQVVDAEELQTRLRQELSGGEEVSVFHADADHGPLSKALQVVLQEESALPHVRYRLRYAMARVIPEGAGGPLDVSLVEVARFNLGPARRAELVEALGEERVAPAEQFGEGQDMAWRLITHPTMGQVADIAYAAQRELSSSKAPACLGSPCRLPKSLNAEVRDWPEPAALDTNVDESTLELSLLEAGLEHLGLLWRDEQGAIHWHTPEWPESVSAGEPFIEISLERGLGQDDGVDLVLHYDQLMDHETQALWERLIAIPSMFGQPIMVGTSQDRELWPRPDWESSAPE